MTAGAYYVIRQARTRVIGSGLLTKAQADREAAAWAAGTGPAVAVPATDALRRAVRCYDQAVLTEALYGGQS
jgi:hypothetical protein